MSDIVQRWSRLRPQERRIFGLATLVLLPLLGWVLLWRPLEAARDAARIAHAETAAQLAEAKALARQVASNPARETAMRTSSPLGAIESVAREQRLLEHIKRREADGAHGARLLLENAPADALIRLLEQLEQRYALKVSQIQIDPVAPGRVNATLTLQGKGS